MARKGSGGCSRTASARQASAGMFDSASSTRARDADAITPLAAIGRPKTVDASVPDTPTRDAIRIHHDAAPAPRKESAVRSSIDRY